MNIKNMRKIIAVILITFVCSLLAVLPLGTSASSISTSLVDVREGIITVSGTIDGAKEGDMVSILVMNPDFEPDDAETNEDAVQHQYVAFTDADGEFSHSFRLLVGEEFEMATFPVYVYGKGFEEPYNEEFFYSSFTKLLEYAKGIYAKVTASGIGADTAEGKILREEAADYLENSAILLDVDDRFYSVSSESIIKGLGKHFAANKIDFGTDEDEASVKEAKEKAGIEKVIEQINRYSALCAFNEGKSEVLFDSDNKIIVDDMLGITDIVASNTTLDEIIGDVDKDGISKINSGLLKQNIEDEEDLAVIYAKNIILYAIKNNTKNGWAYISDILTEKNAEFAGFDIKEYLELDSVDKANALIVENKASLTLANLEDKIEEYAEEADTSGTNTPTYGGGGGGGRGSGVSVGTLLPPLDETETKEEPKEVFSDIATYTWAKEAILYLNAKGIINGTGDGMFKPADVLTREQAVKIICLACGLDKTKADEAVFADEADGAWYKNYLAIARGNGIINGTGENRFGVGNAISREEFVTMLFRAIKANASQDVINFADGTEVSSFAKDAVAYFASLGIVNGYEDGTFRPRASISRAEAAKVVYELIRKGDK